MLPDVKVEFYIFLNSIYAGLISGIVYDLYRVIRYCFKPKRIATLIEDFLFWLGIGLIFFYIINKANWGQLRGYIFFGFFIGGLMYLKVLSKVLFPLLLKLFNKVIFIIKGIHYVLKFPFIKANKIVAPRVKKLRRIKRIPQESVREIIRLTRIILQKK